MRVIALATLMQLKLLVNDIKTVVAIPLLDIATDENGFTMSVNLTYVYQCVITKLVTCTAQ